MNLSRPGAREGNRPQREPALSTHLHLCCSLGILTVELRSAGMERNNVYLSALSVWLCDNDAYDGGNSYPGPFEEEDGEPAGVEWGCSCHLESSILHIPSGRAVRAEA